MNLPFEFTQEQLANTVQEIFDNYPEANSPSLICTKWNYTGVLPNGSVGHNQFPMTFEDTEEVKTHLLTQDMAIEGFKKLLNLIITGQIHLDMGGDDLLDPCSYDSIGADAILQCAIFGEVKYG